MITIYFIISINMKFIRRLFWLIVFLALIVVWFFLYNFLQKEEVIVLNNTKSIMVRLRAVSKLETAEMEFAKTMTAEKEWQDLFEWTTIDDQIYDFLFKDKMVFNLEWRVVAWIDLEKIATWDIITNLDWSVSIKLPEAEILYVKIDKNDVPDRELGILAGWGYANMETDIREAAEKEMEEEAIEKWILEAATKNAHIALAWLLQEMNIKLSDGNIFTNNDNGDNDKNNEDNSTWNTYEL